MVPIELKVVAGSMILGSDATPMLLIGDFKSTEGTLEVTDVGSMHCLLLICSLDPLVTITK